MTRITLSLDNTTAQRLRGRARREKTSVSKWVAGRVDQIVQPKWPDGYFDLFGALKDERFECLPQPPFQNDSPRGTL